MTAKEYKKPLRTKLQRHTSILVWKSYLQRQRRWRLLLVESVFSAIALLTAVFIAKPIFLTPIQAVPETPLTSEDIIASLNKKNILGFAPNVELYNSIMYRAAAKLGVDIMSASTEDELNNMLYIRSRGTPISNPVIWIVWKPTEENMWKFSIRSTERARYVTGAESTAHNPHLRSGVLAVQLAVSEAILSHVGGDTPKYELSLASMPISPLMQQKRVRRAISIILLCLTLALLPPVIETEWLVVSETINRFKRSLRIRGVDYSSMYVGWVAYAYLTALPICLLASITLTLIFRWIHLLFTLVLMLAYISVMIMLALIMAMFHTEPWIACLWSTLFTLLQTFLAELIVHHQIDLRHDVITFFLHLIIPPLGLMHGLNEFALLQTGQEGRWQGNSIIFTITSWLLMIVFYFCFLMLLQRTIRQHTIGGQVTWKSIIFKKAELDRQREPCHKTLRSSLFSENRDITCRMAELNAALCLDAPLHHNWLDFVNKLDKNKLHQIETPTGREREKLQEVDELVAKAISFRNVTKSVMGGPILENITFDIYRCEFTMLYSEHVQSKVITTIEDLLTGLVDPDKGSINVLGNEVRPGYSFMSVPYMLGYCHRTGCLVDDLTVQETLTLYCSICLWNESAEYVTAYVHIRSKRLLPECDLERVKHEFVRNLGVYYRAQLSWAIAMLLEPRIIILPPFSPHSIYTAVIKDKIMQYKKYITIVKLCFTSISLEYADRVFIFDNKLLVFGGSPAYMFFKYGREYRVRLTFRSNGQSSESVVEELLLTTSAAGATVRAHLGSLLILRLPTHPTANVALLIQELSDNSRKYGIISMNISVPDSEEVCNRAIYESRASTHGTAEEHEITRNALINISQPVKWKRHDSLCCNFTHLKYIGWKFISFYSHYRLSLVITITSALLAGIFIGLSLSKVLSEMERDRATKSILHGTILTVEALEQKTNLILRCDNSSRSRSIARAYVFSETNSTEKEVENMMYTALLYPESLTEYLVTRAIDSPQQYVYMFAYGLDVAVKNETLNLRVLYSPLHYDHGAAARSLARTFMALMRHYTERLDSTIQVTDDPLALDLTTWLKTALEPPIFIQFLLILTISHITLIPSMESGFVRHTQIHAMDFSPARYWCNLFLCDFILYIMLVVVMTVAMLLVMLLVAPMTFYYRDLVVVPIMLTVYGVGSIPQAYLFSLGPRVALNTMTFVIFNVVFASSAFELYLAVNSIYSQMKFFCVTMVSLKNYVNNQYIFFVPAKCGVLQTCFSRKFYLSKNYGVLVEIIATTCTAMVFMMILLLWEYKYIQRVWAYIVRNWIYSKKKPYEAESEGAKQEKEDALNKHSELIKKQKYKVDTFGEYLLACNVSQRRSGNSYLRNIYLGVGKGEALAISGLLHHGRLRLCEVLAGYVMPSEGELWSVSKWRITRNPHAYTRQVTFCCNHEPLPQWMTVRRALQMVATLRGVPRDCLYREVMDYMDALELHPKRHTPILYLSVNERARLHFAAAVVGAPPIVIMEECTAYQKYSVRRAMYLILYNLRRRGHAIVISSSSVESHLPVTNRLAIFVEGHIYDIDELDKLVERYSEKGYTVVLHLKDEINIPALFSKYFKKIVINDVSEVLVNVQVLDLDLTWAAIFAKMEKLQMENRHIYSYIVSAIPIDYIYNTILSHETTSEFVEEDNTRCYQYLFPHKPKVLPRQEKLNNLLPFEKKFNMTKLKELPWSVIFNR